MSITCDMTTDLYPLYKDGLASSDSVREIRRHLSKCPRCRAFYKKYNCMDKKIYASKHQHSSSPDAYSAIVRRLKKHKMIKTLSFSFILALCAAVSYISYSNSSGSINNDL